MRSMLNKTHALILVVTLMLANQAGASNLSKMQQAIHASPMPNLMGLILMNAKALKLNEQQHLAAKGWREANQEAVAKLIKQIGATEKQINQAALVSIEPEALEQLKTKLSNLRNELIDLKYRCVNFVKQTLNPQQWQQLMQIQDEKLRFIAKAKKETNEVQAFLKASPMPKLMFIIIAHGDQLELTEQQQTQLQDWRNKHMIHWSKLFDQVIQTEKDITRRAFTMEAQQVLMASFDEVAQKRREMAQMSLNCRDNMKKVLNQQQWDKLLSLFQSYL